MFSKFCNSRVLISEKKPIKAEYEKNSYNSK